MEYPHFGLTTPPAPEGPIPDSWPNGLGVAMEVV